MEKYRLSLNRNGKIECVCNRGEIGCPSLNFKDLKSFYSFLKNRISSFDEFVIEQDSINITWHERNGEIHRIRSARIDFTASLRNAIDEDIKNIYGEYRRHREALDFLKARCREELHKGNFSCDNTVLFSYCEHILKVYIAYRKTETLYDEESDKRFLDFLKAKRENFINEKYKKIAEEENESDKKGRIISFCTSGINGCLIALLIHSPLYLVICILGTIIASVFCREYFNKNHDAEIEMCKKSIDEYQSLIEDLKANIIDAKNKRLSDQEKFYNFVKQDIDHMKAHSNEDYAELLTQIEKLQKSYTKNMLERRNINIYHYLLALAYLEIDIYSRETGVGLKSEYACPINKETILKRLKLMGFEGTAEYSQDTHLMTLLESVDRIIETPFVGCEAEVARLNRIAIDYASEALKQLHQDEDFDVNKIDDVVREGQSETSIITKRLQAARNYDELCSLMDDLSAHLAVDPNMNVEKGITFQQ